MAWSDRSDPRPPENEYEGKPISPLDPCPFCGGTPTVVRAGDRFQSTIIRPLGPCPFCGGTPTVVRAGDRFQSTIIRCEDCGCRHESADEGSRVGRSWNERWIRSPIGQQAGREAEDDRVPVDELLMDDQARQSRRSHVERTQAAPKDITTTVTADLPRGPVAWQEFGKDHWCLTGQYGMRPILLDMPPGTKLLNAKTGLLVDFAPGHPIAVALAAAYNDWRGAHCAPLL